MVDFRLCSKYASAAQLLQFLNKIGCIQQVSIWEYSPYEYLGADVLLFWRADWVVAESLSSIREIPLVFFHAFLPLEFELLV